MALVTQAQVEYANISFVPLGRIFQLIGCKWFSLAIITPGKFEPKCIEELPEQPNYKSF